jgi:hypothetical protein
MEIDHVMKSVLASGLGVCYNKCIPANERDYLYPNEKNCVSKCIEKYSESRFKLISTVIETFSIGETHEEF